MLRLVPGVGCALAALLVAAPALAGDLGGLRGSLPGSWDFAEEPDPLGFELGLRYWYSYGAQSHSITDGGGTDTFTSEDITGILEGHLRIDDYSTGWFLKGLAGYRVHTSGAYDNSYGTGDVIVDGNIGYAGADVGSYVFGNPEADGFGVGLLGGYLYWNDSPNMGRANFTTAESEDDIEWSDTNGQWAVGFDSEPNNLDIHAIRLGFNATAKVNDWFDINAEFVAVPYAWVSGTLGAHGPTIPGYGLPCATPAPDYCAPIDFKSSPTSITGWGYGGQAEVMLGVHPTDNLTLRFGGRAWYLQGNYDATWEQVSITPPQEGAPPDPDPAFNPPSYGQQGVISPANPFSILRLGALFEMTYSF